MPQLGLCQATTAGCPGTNKIKGQMIQRTTKPKTSPLVITPARAGLLQRKCTCDGTPSPTGECDQCRRKRLHGKAYQPSPFSSQPAEVPPIVHEVLRSAGQPLDPAT